MRNDYFKAGVQLHWEIDPEDRNVAVYESGHIPVALTVDDTLMGDPVLPGFALPLWELFAELDRQR